MKAGTSGGRTGWKAGWSARSNSGLSLGFLRAVTYALLRPVAVQKIPLFSKRCRFFSDEPAVAFAGTFSFRVGIASI